MALMVDPDMTHYRAGGTTSVETSTRQASRRFPDALFPLAARLAAMSTPHAAAVKTEGLRRTFGERMTLYPRGGHCGNLTYRVNAHDMLEFFRG